MLLKMIVVQCLIIVGLSNAYPQDDDLLIKYPHVVLTNGIVETSVFIPDPEKGFYRSTRFEWSGMIYHLSCGGHSYFLQRQEKHPLPLRQDHDPEKSDNAAGLPDQFQNGPPRMEDEKTIMIIGVGNLDGATRKIVDSGRWRTTSGQNWIEFTHTLRNDYGYGYTYMKRIELTESKPELIISYSLKNTGSRTITSEQYNHNFFTIDNEYIGENYELRLFFPAKFQTFHPEVFKKKGSFLPYAAIEKHRIVILKTIDVKGGIFSIMEGFGDDVSQHHGIIKNKKTGACVDIRGDASLSGFHFWADDMTICPEFFVAIAVEPGGMQEWKRVYTFYED